MISAGVIEGGSVTSGRSQSPPPPPFDFPLLPHDGEVGPDLPLLPVLHTEGDVGPGRR